MEEDWGLSATAKPFSLYQKADPEEMAKSEGFINQLIYNSWKPAQRKLYRQKRTQYLIQKYKEAEELSLDQITEGLSQISMIKEIDATEEPEIDHLMAKFNRMKLDALKKQNDK